MKTELKRFVRPISESELASVLDSPGSVQTEPLGIEANLQTVHSVVDEIRKTAAKTQAALRSRWDKKMVGPLHRALRILPMHAAMDTAFWHWLCIVELRDFVWLRWNGRVPKNASQVLSSQSSMSERFLGNRSLRGVSRNALARLYWCGRTLYSEDDGYDLAEQALDNQDFFQAIFERKFGLYPPAAHACLRVLGDASEDERRQATKDLNHVLTTIAVETLTQPDIEGLLVTTKSVHAD